MGNVCGCVRAEKEEQYFDPAKTPLSPEKSSPGRKYFRRKRSQKAVGDTGPVGHSSGREGKKGGGGQPAREQPAVSSRELVPEDPGEQKPPPSAVDSGSCRVTVSSAQNNDSEGQVSAPDKTISEEDSPPYCTERERHLDDVNTNQRAFQRKDDVSAVQKAASLSSVLCVPEKSLGNNGLVENLSKSYSSIQEHHRTERVHPHETYRPQCTKRRHHSPRGSVSSVSKDAPRNDGCEISDIHVTGESEDMSAKERLLLWTQQATEGYAGVRCENFTTCWRDGKLFNAIIHKYRPDLIDMNTVAVQSNLANLEHAFYVAEKIGVIRLLDPEDVDVSSPDEKSVITYVSSLYDAFPKVPEGGEGIGANDVEVKWIEYQNMVNYLIQWIRHHVVTMSERTFPNNPVELKALYNQYLQFKDKEIPPKETEKSKIKRLYKLLEIWIEFGRIKLLQGYHPNDIEKEWGKLIIAMLEREKALRPEVERFFGPGYVL
ncbi:dystonin-like [Peromyscus eremicus]|uniref:dystonin-like n=1 Tax=Peromyscus eremicus TaxID=42410 RepID=UPI0027DC33DD|nr:dystonin-like [Peromyscus eremicus]